MGRVGWWERIKYVTIIVFPHFLSFFRSNASSYSLPHHTLSKNATIQQPSVLSYECASVYPPITRSQKRVSRPSCRLCARTMYCSYSSRPNTAAEAAVTYNDINTRAPPLVVRDSGRSPRMYSCLSFPAALVSKSSREY